jgi:hypothetical protein
MYLIDAVVAMQARVRRRRRAGAGADASAFLAPPIAG